LYDKLQAYLITNCFYCDMAQVSDCVNHVISIAKLHFYGIRRVSEDWFRTYETIRRQKVVVKSPHTTKIFSLTGIH
jgi:hypothetical protein